MENSVLPQDLFNAVFKHCDLKTKFNLKVTCRRANEKYIVIVNDPLYEYSKKGVVIYNNKHIKKFVLKIKGKESKIKKIASAYRFIVKKYELDAASDVEFTIKWGLVYKKYLCKTVNNKVSIINTTKDKQKVVEYKRERYQRRNFQLWYKGQRSGTYTGETPSQAAKKALTALIKHSEDKDAEFKFAIREKTSGSANKYFYFKGQRTHVKNPSQVNIRDRMGNMRHIQFNYINKVYKRDVDLTIGINN